MLCPACQYNDTKVIDSRVSAGGSAIRRRRECLVCSFRFSTYEQVELLNIYVVKKDGKRELYSQGKLKRGLDTALKKRRITEKQITKLITDIEQEIQKLGVSEISVTEIGEIVMKHLKSVDEVAYIRFASVYRSFESVESFMDELEKLKEE